MKTSIFTTVRRILAIIALFGLTSLHAEEAFHALEKIQSNPRFIRELRGTRHEPSPSTTDWPVFGGNLEQTGLSPDAGPRTGEVAWKSPIGMAWHAAAAVKDGRVYIASPGVTTLAYCLDEKTGEVIWTTPQDSIFQESIPAIHSERAFIRCSDGFLYSFQ
jgi:hypothetical protein